MLSGRISKVGRGSFCTVRCIRVEKASLINTKYTISCRICTALGLANVTHHFAAAAFLLWRTVFRTRSSSRPCRIYLWSCAFFDCKTILHPVISRYGIANFFETVCRVVCPFYLRERDRLSSEDSSFLANETCTS